MLGWSTRRRLIYFLLVFAVIVALAAILAVALRQPPSCTDGKQNQDELGIDCGGSCPRVCPLEISELRVIWSRVFKVVDGRYDTATMVENPNRQHGVRSFRYQIRLLDEENLLVTLRSGEVFINPGETFVIFDGRLEVGRRVPTRALFEILEAPLWQKVTKEKPKLVIGNQLFTNEPVPRLEALVRNESLIDLENITVVTVLSNQEQNALAASSTFIDFLPAGAAKEIVFTWPEPLAEGPAFIDLYPHFDLVKLL